MGPGGCPWDREQTLETLRSTVLEETCELIDAIDIGDAKHIAEELGDLAFNVVFFCRLGEKQGVFTTEQVLKTICEKLVRRHPHVFAESNIDVEDSEAVVEQWERIKAEEKKERESALDGIPAALPALARATKVLRQTRKAALPQLEPKNREEEFGLQLLQLTHKAREEGIDAENALRKVLSKQEAAFRQWEKSASSS